MLYKDKDKAHRDAMYDITRSLATIIIHAVLGPMAPEWNGDSVGLLEHIHIIAHRIVRQYTDVLLEHAAKAYEQALASGDNAWADGLKENIEAFQHKST
jgi:hypothetical protein